ncbi:MAG: hypothetical protein AAGL98_08345 [Planctomycetota bacterium]
MNHDHLADLDHFLDLAEQGRKPGSSSGEYACFKLAEAVTEHALVLDPTATTGLRAFVLLAQSRPSECRNLFGGLAATR